MMPTKVIYPFENIQSKVAAAYLNEIADDIYNENTTLEDLEDLEQHLVRFIEYMRRAQLTVVINDPSKIPGGHF